jgi:hypothetical protein
VSQVWWPLVRSPINHNNLHSIGATNLKPPYHTSPLAQEISQPNYSVTHDNWDCPALAFTQGQLTLLNFHAVNKLAHSCGASNAIFFPQTSICSHCTTDIAEYISDKVRSIVQCIGTKIYIQNYCKTFCNINFYKKSVYIYVCMYGMRVSWQ